MVPSVALMYDWAVDFYTGSVHYVMCGAVDGSDQPARPQTRNINNRKGLPKTNRQVLPQS